ncbi:PREDICTED: DEAD-box ATP-dependent RNA helicase 31 [Tarenaya hassleriana]|uniref:DEAD-box ATP-dependent RNA helicase 31 n=1 Tax=Tarenaya hassleriana TaxID=28532 RepID=UPI00053CA7E9|nr:PREDICTED: DEAD-box ATP-dependent RNA helicase 31 [Tarenaya hassleriana]
MPFKLPPHLRFLGHSLPSSRFVSMNLAGPACSSRSVHAISRAFPLRLRFLGLGSRVSFSTRPNRIRPGSTSEFGGSRERGEVRASKSLVEDEAELSDWVSELRTGSLRGRATSEDDDSYSGGIRSRGGNRETGRIRDGKRGREDDFDRFGGSNRRRTRDSVDSLRNKRSSDVDGGRNGGNRGRSTQSSLRGRKERNLDSGFRGERDRGNHKGYLKGKRETRREDRFEVEGSEVSDDEDVKKVLMGGIGDLLSEEGSDEDEDDDFLSKKATSALGFDDEKIVEAGRAKILREQTSDSYLTETRFDQYPLSASSLKAIKDAGYEKMTVVQEATLPGILKGKDVLAKAKTGTGKTVAFLLPSIEVVVKSPPASRDNKRPPILVLVICPTRELASQAAAEANTLLKYHSSIGVQVVMGGTRLALEQKRMQANPCQILVATPGRLKDHIENTAGFATRLMGVKVLVLDEADHLLDMGFRKDIERIIAAVPKQRQTLLFSATVPEEVRQICHIALRRDHEFVNTVHEGSGETHSQVRQTHMVAALDKHFSLLYTLLKEHIADNVDYKVIIFCTTAMVTRFVADLLGELNLNVREIHSRKPQSYRTRVSDEFRKSKGLILVTSDVSARGVDYPDVTLVIQVGVPADREQYIHRLGRTGRKGKEGQGILLLAPWEEYFISSVKDLPITKSPLPTIDPEAVKKVQKALCHVEMKNKEAAYQAWLGYYNSQKMVGRDKYKLVELANEFSRSMGLDIPPSIPKLVLGKMGLRNIPGLRTK